MILADIGNTRAHIWEEGLIAHMGIDEAIGRYHAQRVYYINVNSHYSDALSALASWHDLSNALHIVGEYDGMGTDRKALCLSHSEGVFVDAGSAITVDRVEEGSYQGGFILPGLKAYRRMYAAISPVLDVSIKTPIDPDILPKSTVGSVSYGTVAPIVAVVARIRGSLPLYFTGGDGAQLAKYFADSHYDENLVFSGMRTVLTNLNGV